MVDKTMDGAGNSAEIVPNDAPGIYRNSNGISAEGRRPVEAVSIFSKYIRVTRTSRDVEISITPAAFTELVDGTTTKGHNSPCSTEYH
jgi:hypothetical protein